MSLLKPNCSEQHLDFNKVSHEKGLVCENEMLEAFLWNSSCYWH